MKTHLKSTPLFSAATTALVLLAGMLASCSKDDDQNTAPKITAPAGKIVARINGASFETDGEAVIDNNQIIVEGDTDAESLSIFITNAAKTGTYDAKGAQTGAATPDAEINYSTDVALYSSFFATGGTKAGTVTITEIDATGKTISGTFSSTVLLNGNTKEITEGSFNKLPYITTAGSSVTAKIDGAAFTAITAEGELEDGAISITGAALNTSRIIGLGFDEDIAAGTYDIGLLSNNDIFAACIVNFETFVAGTGTLTITKNDRSLKRVEGTFSFHASSTPGTAGHNITEGTFAVTYH